MNNFGGAFDNINLKPKDIGTASVKEKNRELSIWKK